MTNLELKVLETVSETLQGFNTYQMYKALYDIFEKYKDNSDLRKEILATVQSEAFKVKQITESAKSWVDLLVKNK